ncbi:MAG TPA: tetratricopeptide repeat protein [Candidatus Sulfotelmatobacter sp.]|nr:tetratricopeptide repeat protein [Candidatus Sulfotelmatobacter sp.]
MRAETRHQLKQDAFTRVTMEAAEKTAHWTVEHRSTLVIGVIVAAVVVTSIAGGWYYLSLQDEKASLELSQAVRTMQTPLRPAGSPPQPDYPSFASLKERSVAADKQLQAIVDKYPHTRTADMARYLLGVNAANVGDSVLAERDLKKVISTGNGELVSLAKLALASQYGNEKRTKEAIALYQELINKPTASVSKNTAQLQLAELYQDSNQTADAKRIYERIKKDSPNTEAAQLATEKMAQLK